MLIAWGLLNVLTGCAPLGTPPSPGPSGQAANTPSAKPREVRVGPSIQELTTLPPAPAVGPGVSPPVAVPTSGPPVNVVVVSRYPNPRDPLWYQINASILESTGRVLMPDGQFQVRLQPSPSVSDLWPQTGEITWERFDPVVRVLPGGRGPGAWRIEGIPDKRQPGEWLDCKALMQIPLAEVAEVMPVGCTSVRVTLEFIPRSASMGPVAPETFDIPLKGPGGQPLVGDQVGLPLPENPVATARLTALSPSAAMTLMARRVKLDAAPDAPTPDDEDLAWLSGEPFSAVALELFDAANQSTQPLGRLRFEVAAAPNSAPAGSSPPDEGFVPLDISGDPRIFAQRLAATDAHHQSGNRLALRTLLRLPRQATSQALGDQVGGPAQRALWLRVTFVPAATTSTGVVAKSVSAIVALGEAEQSR